MKTENDRGFTLLELMIVVTTMGILSVSSVNMYQEVRDSVYEKMVLLTLQQARTAFEGSFSDLSRGFGDLEEYGAARWWPITNAGIITDPEVKALLPGLALSKDIVVHLQYNPICYRIPWCITHGITVFHCKLSPLRYYQYLEMHTPDMNLLMKNVALPEGFHSNCG